MIHLIAIIWNYLYYVGIWLVIDFSKVTEIKIIVNKS